MLSSGLQHNGSLLMTADASESFSTTLCGFGLVSLILCVVSSPKFLELLFLADLVQTLFNTTVSEGVLSNRNVDDQATPLSPLTLLQESFML